MKTLVSVLFLLGVWIIPIKKSSAAKEKTTAKSVNMADSVRNLMIKHEIRFVEIVHTQSKLETGYYSSPVFKGGFNIAGMRFNKRGICVGKYLNHAKYNSIEDSVIDLKLWQEQRIAAYERKYGSITSEEKYYHFLEHLVIGKSVYRYAEDPNYIQKLKKLRM